MWRPSWIPFTAIGADALAGLCVDAETGRIWYWNEYAERSVKFESLTDYMEEMADVLEVPSLAEEARVGLMNGFLVWGRRAMMPSVRCGSRWLDEACGVSVRTHPTHPLGQVEGRGKMIESAEEFIRLRFSDAPEEYGRSSSEPAPPEVWREVVDRHPEARFWVANNKSVPLEILRELANDSDPRVRSMVASKRKLTPDLLTELAVDPDESVRLTVARHRNVPRSVLEQLRTDAWEEVRDVARDRLESGHW